MARDTAAHMSKMTKMGSSRSTARKYYDHNLMQEVDVDAHHAETHTKIERPQPVGLTAVPLKQSEEQQSQKSQSGNGQNDNLNHNQPKGEAAEHFVMYVGGDHSHPVAIASDDRRVRPYDMKEGDNALYHAAGSEQMVYMNDKGAYLISLDGKSVKNKKSNETRMASLRHVTKKMQSHKIEGQQQQQQEYKHEGDTINTEVRCTKDKIEFLIGGQVVGSFSRDSQGKTTLQTDTTNNFQNTAEKHRIVSQQTLLHKAYASITHDAPSINGYSDSGSGGPWDSGMT